jgi:3-oxoacid CoA-transferase
MIRGGHVDVTVMGALQVDEKADLANWAVPGKPLLGVGGAMDLASAAKRLLITMTHTARGGASKIVPECTLPLTVLGAVDMVVTELAVFTFEDNQLTLSSSCQGQLFRRSAPKRRRHLSNDWLPDANRRYFSPRPVMSPEPELEELTVGLP